MRCWICQPCSLPTSLGTNKRLRSLQGIASPFKFTKLLGEVEAVPYVFSFVASSPQRPTAEGSPARSVQLRHGLGSQGADAAAVKRQLADIVQSIVGRQVCYLVLLVRSPVLAPTFQGLVPAGI